VGAVQKLATVVIVGLVALASVLVVYLADEPNRRTAEAEEQEEVAIERGIETYIANCVTCHGPGGEGASAEDGRIGAPLGGNTEDGGAAQELNQSEDPVERAARHRVIVNTLQNGRGVLMPAWGRGAEGGALLNDEQIEELALMIQNGDWNEIYNETVVTTREQLAAAGSPVPETGGVYPTAGPVPQQSQPQPTAAAMNTAQDPAPTVAADAGGGGQAPAVTLEGYDIGWRANGQDTAGGPLTVTAALGSVITLPNVGAGPHNFAIDALGVDIDMPVGETVEYTVPGDLAPGEYEFYCNVPGHAAAGMVGTLIVQ